MIPAVKAKLLEGKRGLIVGIANENSIAWGCAKAFRAFGAELAARVPAEVWSETWSRLSRVDRSWR